MEFKTTEEICFEAVKFMDAENVEWHNTNSENEDKKWIALDDVLKLIFDIEKATPDKTKDVKGIHIQKIWDLIYKFRTELNTPKL